MLHQWTLCKFTLITQARTSGNPEIPSAMLTSPYIDFLVDPALFKSVRGDGTRKRNVRFLYILALVGGGFVGGGVQQGGGTKAVLWLGMGLRGITMVWIAMLPRRRTVEG
jgi:hypothetical protein